MEELRITHVHDLTREEFKTKMITEIKSELQHFLTNYKPVEPNEYLTRKEISKIFKVTVVTLIDWDKKGILKPYRLGNLIRYKRSEIEQSLILKKS